ncbi:MAG: cell wall-binding repeat-containing protein [Parcubacteria group bacterium]
MRKTARTISTLLVVILTLGILVTKPATTRAAEDIGRIAGSNRFETAAMTSAATYMPGAAQGVVLASGRTFPDALSGVSLARVIDGPLLLTEKDSLPAPTQTELLRALTPNNFMAVYVLGGTGAISQAVADQVAALGYTVIRISGNDRYQTAKAIAEQIDQLRSNDEDTAYIVSGNAYADALSISPFAGLGKQVLLLSQPKTLSDSVKEYLASNQAVIHITIVGGTSVISGGIQEELAELGYSVGRIAGADRYETSVQVAWLFGGSPEGIGVASGEGFSDALAAGPQLAGLSWPLLLTKKTNIGCIATGNYLYDNRDSIGEGHLYGGTAVIAGATEVYAESLIQGLAAPGNCETTDEPPPADNGGGDTSGGDSGSQCDPNYSGACVPNVYPQDVDCEGGSGNGPYYVQGPVQVIGDDRYNLDNDGNGVGCES